MKVKVVREFINKHTKELHKVNDTFECNSKRFKEIESTGHFVEEVKSEAKSEPVKAETK